MSEELNKEFWTQINEIEQLNCRVNSCRSIIAICAERTLGDESGALWAASDILEGIENQIDVRIAILMQIYKKLPVKKAKKLSEDELAIVREAIRQTMAEFLAKQK